MDHLFSSQDRRFLRQLSISPGDEPVTRQEQAAGLAVADLPSEPLPPDVRPGPDGNLLAGCRTAILITAAAVLIGYAVWWLLQ